MLWKKVASALEGLNDCKLVRYTESENDSMIEGMKGLQVIKSKKCFEHHKMAKWFVQIFAGILLNL